MAKGNAAQQKPGEVVLLSGGNPQIAKGYGDEPVQAYIAAMPGWKSDIGRRIDALEERLGVKLLRRTTRRITLTHEGAAFLETSQRLLTDLSNAEASVSAGGVKASGHLRLTAPAGFGRRHVAPLVPRFLEEPSLRSYASVTAKAKPRVLVEAYRRPEPPYAAGKEAARFKDEYISSEHFLLAAAERDPGHHQDRGQRGDDARHRETVEPGPPASGARAEQDVRRPAAGRAGVAAPGRWRKGPRSCFGTPSLHREDALRSLLDEDDDEHQHHDLGQHRAGPALQQLVQHAQAERGVDR